MCDIDPLCGEGWHTEGWTVLMPPSARSATSMTKLVATQPGVDINKQALRSELVGHDLSSAGRSRRSGSETKGLSLRLPGRCLALLPASGDQATVPPL
jgi:hypothetical protein